MCHSSCIAFGVRVLTPSIVNGADVLEVGAYDVNGSLRPHVRSLGPRSYLGVDMSAGPNVDRVIDARHLVSVFGPAAFDVVVTTEMLEHVRDWAVVVSNLKRVVRPGGHLLVTTRSAGFPRHDYPGDFWRYEINDMRRIFGDMTILTLESDPEAPGVFLLAQRPVGFVERTTRITLFSMVTGRRTRHLGDLKLAWYRVRAASGREIGRAAHSLGLTSSMVATGTRRAVRRSIRAVWVTLPRGLRARVKRALGLGELRR